MKATLIGQRSPFIVTGDFIKPCEPGKTLVFNLELQRKVGSPDGEARINFTVDGIHDAPQNWGLPEFFLNGVKIDPRVDFFKVPDDKPVNLGISIYIKEDAPWFREFKMYVHIVPANDT